MKNANDDLPMRGSLALKVFAGTFFIAAVLVVAMTARSILQIDRGFAHYVTAMEASHLQSVVDALEQGYRRTGDWSFIPGEPGSYRRWVGQALRAGRPPPERSPQEVSKPGPGLDDGVPPIFDASARPSETLPEPYAWSRPPGPPGGGPPPDRLELLSRMAFFTPRGERFAGANVAVADCVTLPVRMDGRVVAQVGLRDMALHLAEGDRAYERQQWRDALAVGLAGLALSAVMAWIFARHVRRPVADIEAGTGALAAGQLDVRLPAARTDEFGRIASHFNRMAERLEQLERGRREWMASTSHELRTPLSVLRALVEALQEGIRKGDGPTLQRLHDQVMSLSHLVDDLYQLAQHDAGSAQEMCDAVDARMLIEDVLDAQLPRLAAAGIEATLVDHSDDADVWGNPQRLGQLFHNLIENTLRYTDAPGRLHIGLALAAGADGKRMWQAEFDDSAPAVADAALPRLTERFFRAEGSRSRATGGSGLGLAICRAIVEEHGGSLAVHHSSLGGLRVTVLLPLASTDVADSGSATSGRHP